MAREAVVAREAELRQLEGYLECALEGQGLVCWVTGEAGSGKTTLLAEFTRRAQQTEKDLVVAVGQSDAQTGTGDPYLPFREVLGQLTGDVEAKLAQGSISKENASRLRKVLGFSGQALVELGPDLIDIFVPWAGIATRAAAFLAGKAGWLEGLERLKKRPEGELKSSLEQSHIFEQYTNVLTRLAEKQPLVLVLDDLQWADPASIGLLFRLGRRVGGSQILIVGAYRPEEVALGRDGERHPLEKVLAEFKRYHGDKMIDLDHARQAAGAQFVDAFLGTEPNRLGEAFCRALYEHTGGHPLFTVELLRNMQERGDLVQDQDGYWVQGSQLDWDNLPARVEGVIEERIGRLAEELREVLTVASVEGERFTAEVVAGVQSLAARELVRRLSGELEKRHRLVSAQGVQRLGEQRLSLYRFQHNLFQDYLYRELGEAERAYLHEEVGELLESLYGEQAVEVAVQLVRHFELAGDERKTRRYLRLAGEDAARRYANQEAIHYLSRALELTPDERAQERYEILMTRQAVYKLGGEKKAQAGDLEVLQQLADAIDDDQLRAQVFMRKAIYHNAVAEYDSAQECAKQAIHLAHSADKHLIEAQGYLEWGRALWYVSEYDRSNVQLEVALELSKQAGLDRTKAMVKMAFGLNATWQGDFEKAQDYYLQALPIFQRLGDRVGENDLLLNLGSSYNYQGNYVQAAQHFDSAYKGYRETGDKQGEARVLGNLGVVQANQGDLRGAREYFDQSYQASHVIEDQYSESLSLCNLGQVSAELGDFKASMEYYEQALLDSRAIDQRLHEAIALIGLCSTNIRLGDFYTAYQQGSLALEFTQQIGDRLFEVNARFHIGMVLDSLGVFEQAGEHYHSALEIAREIGSEKEQGMILAFLGLFHLHMGENDIATKHCREALVIAKKLGDRDTKANAYIHLGQALVKLGDFDAAMDAFKRALKLRHESGQLHLTVEPQAGMAYVSMLKGDLSQTIVLIKPVIEQLESNALAGTVEPLRVYLTCYRILAALDDPQAESLLASGREYLEEHASKIEDEQLRRSFLENIPSHREIKLLFDEMMLANQR